MSQTKTPGVKQLNQQRNQAMEGADSGLVLEENRNQ